MPLNLEAANAVLQQDYAPWIAGELGIFPDDGLTHEEHVAAHRAYMTELRRWDVERYRMGRSWHPPTLFPRLGRIEERIDLARGRVRAQHQRARDAVAVLRGKAWIEE